MGPRKAGQWRLSSRERGWATRRHRRPPDASATNQFPFLAQPQRVERALQVPLAVQECAKESRNSHELDKEQDT